MIGLILLSYLCGSVPTAVWTGKVLKNIDVREHGSGNAGATNVYRVLGWKAALFVVVIDVAKGFIPAFWFPNLLMQQPPAWAGLVAGICAVLGHVWTVLAGFRGGKGVGTSAGMLLALFPLSMPFCLIVFALVVGTTGYVSLASMLATLTLPLSLLYFHFSGRTVVPLHLWLASVSLFLFIVFTHRSNLKRLVQGTEKSIRKKKSASTSI